MIMPKSQGENLIVDSSTHIGSVYSQVVGITVTDVDITLDFVYVNPRDKTKGQVVTRVTLPRSAGEGLANAIIATIKKHEKK